MLPFRRGRFPPDDRTGLAVPDGLLFTAALLLAGVDTKDESGVWRGGRGRDGVANAGVCVVFCFFAEGIIAGADGDSDGEAEAGWRMLAVEGLRNMALSCLLWSEGGES